MSARAASSVVKGLGLLGPALRDAGVTGRVLVVGTKGSAQRAPYNRTVMALQKSKFQCAKYLCQTSEARVEHINEAVLMAEKTGCGAVVAVGGGSMMDVGKAVGLVLANGGNIRDYALKKDTVDIAPIHIAAVPTALGSGAELSDSLVAFDTEEERALVFQNVHLVPSTVVVDVEMLSGLPALTQSNMCVSNLSRTLDYLLDVGSDFDIDRGDDSSDAIQALAGLELSIADLTNQASAFGTSKGQPADSVPIEEFLNSKYMSSFQGGRLTSTHGIPVSARLSQTVCGMFLLPYSTVNASLFLPFLQARIDFARAKPNRENDGFISRVEDCAKIVCRDENATIQSLMFHLSDIISSLGVQRIEDLQITKEDADVAVSLIFAEDDLEIAHRLGRSALLDLLQGRT